MRKFTLIACTAALFVAAVGCTKYYKVTDPSTGHVYYTKDVDDKKSGAVTLKDAATGEKVTIQNSRVTEVNKEEYETNRAGNK